MPEYRLYSYIPQFSKYLNLKASLTSSQAILEHEGILYIARMDNCIDGDELYSSITDIRMGKGTNVVYLCAAIYATAFNFFSILLYFI